MEEGTIALIIMSSLIFLIFLGFLIWGIASGQFKGVEEAKYQLFKNNTRKAEKMKPEAPNQSLPGDKDVN